jgi:quinol monooxygenase YgiN
VLAIGLLRNHHRKEALMPHEHVAVYKLQTSASEVVKRAEQGMVPNLRRQPGFLAYDLIETGTNSLISISRWQSQEQAEEATKSAASWVKENLGFMLILVENHAGEVVLASQES